MINQGKEEIIWRDTSGKTPPGATGGIQTARFPAFEGEEPAMLSIALLSQTGQYLATVREGDETNLALLVVLFIVLMWTFHQAVMVMTQMLRAAVAAARRALGLAVIPIIVIGLLIAAMM